MIYKKMVLFIQTLLFTISATCCPQNLLLDATVTLCTFLSMPLNLSTACKMHSLTKINMVLGDGINISPERPTLSSDVQEHMSPEGILITQ